MIDKVNRQLLRLIEKGLPIVSRPYANISQQLNISENEVIERLIKLKQQGLVKRLGVIVNHRQLGYQANAMVVFNIPDDVVEYVGYKMSQFNFVNLCYRRPRRGEDWPYNLYCMIHGKSREKVVQQLAMLIETADLSNFNYEVLFSRHCFKQRGAIYRINSKEQKAVAYG